MNNEHDVYERLIVQRSSYYKQNTYPNDKGSFAYVHVKQPLTQKELDLSLTSESLTIGVCTIESGSNLVKNPSIDIDNHDGTLNIIPDIKKIYDEGVKRGYSPFIEASSGNNVNNGAHVCFICKPTQAKTIRQELQNILNYLKFDCEVNPKQDNVDRDKFGNQVKLIWQFHNRTKARSTIINPETMQPFERQDAINYLMALPDSVFNGNNEAETPQDEIKAPIIACNEPIKQDSNSNRTFDGVFKLDNIKPCIKACYDNKWILHGKGDAGHNFRINIAGNLLYNGATEKQVHEYFSIQPDYSKKMTDIQINSINEYLASGKKPMGCKKIIEDCSPLLNGLCDAIQCEYKPKEKKESKKEAKDVKAPLELPPIPHEAIDQSLYDINNHLTTFKKWLAIKEDYNIIAPLCAFIGNFVPGESDIIGIIAPSGSTKTEIIRSFGEHENQYSYPISSMTEHTLVSGHEDNIDTIPILRHRVMLIKDLTSVLAKKEDVRSGIFADFRDITDGHIRKEFGNGIKKEYLNIHSSILFASTNAIERYYTMYSNLGQRMVFVRPNNDPKEARIQSEKNRYSLEQMRKELHDSTMRIIYNALKNINEKGASKIPEDTKEEIGSLCDFLALIRTAIHHDIKGDIDELPEPEFPTRVYNTICKLTEVHASLNGRLTANEDDKKFALRIIVDNIPTIRLQILQHLAVEEQTTSQISKNAELPTSTGKRVLDDLAALHLVVKVPRDMKGEFSDDKRSDSFYVSDEVATILEQLKGVIRRGCIVNDQLTQYNKVILNKSNILDNNVLSQYDSIPLESHPSIIEKSVTELPQNEHISLIRSKILELKSTFNAGVPGHVLFKSLEDSGADMQRVRDTVAKLVTSGQLMFSNNKGSQCYHWAGV